MNIFDIYNYISINNVPLKLLAVKKFDIIYVGIIMLNRHKGVEVYAD